MTAIQTLDEILAQMGQADGATPSSCNKNTQQSKKQQPIESPIKPSVSKCQTNADNQAKTVQSDDVDVFKQCHQINLQQVLDTLAVVPEPIYDEYDKAAKYLRWLAFYYLSRRELSQAQLRKKLLDKGCQASAVEALLVEFANKGYQSDERCALMIIRESIRRHRGKQHIINALHQAKLQIAECDLMAMMADRQVWADELADEKDNHQNSTNWLKLAVIARTKKYGDTPPTTPKEKARQLRFLQYRGFELAVCLEALKLTLAEVEG